MHIRHALHKGELDFERGFGEATCMLRLLRCSPCLSAASDQGDLGKYSPTAIYPSATQ